ncbi:unnamed protein product [Phytomonas sp. EM1]|nr:unnamed protein product [Phytomonas sp. EM1]|eukprot:CCW65277.1 unnamed protein product [Phytomonas sp. isolate EM1]
MAEVLVYLNEVVKSVSSRLMPTEIDDVVRFLLGQHEQTVLLDSSTKAIGDPEKGTSVSTGAGLKANPEVHSFASSQSLQQIKIPDGLSAWHDFIPLGIATDSVVWGHSGDGGAALHTFFSSRGFDKVFSVNFTSSNGAALTGSSGILEDGGTQTEGASESLRSIQAARFTCVDAIREWCKVIEDESNGREIELAASKSTTQTTFSNFKAKRMREDAEHGDDFGSRRAVSAERFTVRRLLVIIRCCTDNRATFSTTKSGRNQYRARRKANGSENIEAARRHRYGSDQLQLFLHDFAALGTFHNIRLRRRHWRIHLALLLLPEDQLYGGTLLEQRLEEKVGHQYHVKLFTQNGDYDVDENGGQNGFASFRKLSTPSSTLMRIHRLVSLWEPSLLHRLPCAESTETTFTMNSGSDGTSFRMESLEGPLLQEKRYFFLRPHNLPLCCFLCEALRRFPMLVSSPVLRQWQRVWAVRHSLQDVVLSFHSILMPFAISSHWFAATSEDLISYGCEDNDADPACLSVSTAESQDEVPERRRTAYVDILRDTTDILDGLLSASDALSHGYRLDAAVTFMLLYDELIDPSFTEMHVLRCQPVIEALEAIYDREQRACSQLIGAARKMTQDTIPLVDTKQKARYALKHYLPFSWPSKGVPSVAVEQLSNLRISLTGTLMNCLLHSILSPEASMQEFLQVATYQDASLATLIAPKSNYWRECAHSVVWTLSANNFYQTSIPDSVRVLYLLAAYSQHHEMEKAKQARIVDVQQVAQLSDEAVMLALKELELTGLALINTQSQTAYSLLQ